MFVMNRLLPLWQQTVTVRILPQKTKLWQTKYYGSHGFRIMFEGQFSSMKATSSMVFDRKYTFRNISTQWNGKLITAPRTTSPVPLSVLSCDTIEHTGSFPQLEIQRRYLTEDRKTTALTVWSNLKELKSSPVPALVLGFSGLIPFVSVPVYMTMSQMYLPEIAFAQLAYGAAILSFLGGVRWGFVIPEETVHKPNWFNLGYSVTPSLVAWIGLLLPDPLSLFTVMTGLAGAAYFDTALPGYPPWFKGLRFVLSIVAVLSLWTTFICRFFLSSGKDISLDQKQKD